MAVARILIAGVARNCARTLEPTLEALSEPRQVFVSEER